ncbi:STAS domain-containing protein [Thiolapillus sp.]
MNDVESSISLPPHLSLEVLPDLAVALRKALLADQGLLLDGAEVKSVDGASLQLLLATLQTASHKGIHCRWQAVSTALKDAAVLAGIRKELSMDETQS